MKMLLILTLVFSSLVAKAQSEDKVLSVIKSTQSEMPFQVKEESFEPNILGYACPWPGLRWSYLFNYHVVLRHGHGLAENVLPLREADLAQQFCNWPTAQDVFGSQFVLGLNTKIKVEMELAIVERKVSWAPKAVKMLRETVRALAFGRHLESVAYAPLEAAQAE